MKRLFVAALTAAAWGCVPVETETEDVLTATEHLDDGESWTCEQCRRMLQVCQIACKKNKPPSQLAACRVGCANSYVDCTASCQYAPGPGCGSLNSADCSPWGDP